MACYASKAVEIAKKEDGTKEGNNNWNKYAADLDKTDMYNYPKQNVPYCDVFVDWVIWKACNQNAAEAEKVLCQPKKSAGAGCVYSYGYYKAAGRVGKTPKLGAQIFFGTKESDLYHTGIVIAIKGDKVTTEEGNSDNMVKQHTYTVGAKNKVFGYGYPRYDEEPKEDPQFPENPVDPTTPTEPKKTIDELANEVIQGKWKNYPERKKLLEDAGYNYSEVQKRVNEILGIGSSSESSGESGNKYKVVLSDPKSYLRIRSGPGLNYPEIGKLKLDAEVIIYEQKNGFGRIDSGKWSSMDYMKPIS